MIFARGEFCKCLLILHWISSSSFCFSAILKNKNDMSLHQYSETGHVAQVYYASQAIKNSPIGLVGFSHDCYKVVLAITKKPSALQVCQKEKQIIEKYGKYLGVAMTGYLPDCTYARTKCNLVKQSHILKFGEIPLIDNISKTMSKWLCRGMYIGDEDAIIRPVATAVLLFGRDVSDTLNRLVLVENSGSVKDCEFVSMGYLPGGENTSRKIKEVVKSLISSGAKDCQTVKEELQNIMKQVTDVLFDATDDTISQSTDGVHNADENNEIAVIEAERMGSISVECSICDASGLSETITFSSSKKLSDLMNGGWPGLHI
jgi:20S proteasome alpha/beta subunit